jgi:hypothetical protein
MRRYSRRGKGRAIPTSSKPSRGINTPMTALGSSTINKFGSVTANWGNGLSDTVNAIDFTLSTVGNWTSD